MDLPRVTEVLNPYTSYGNVPGPILKKAALRGTTVHSLCAGIAKGAWITESMVDKNYWGYVASFKLWADKIVKGYKIIEKRYADKELGYTGQIDCVIVTHERKTILVDLKTSLNEQKTYPLQMAAYAYLLGNQGTRIDGAMLVYLNKDGEFPKVDFLEEMDEELEVFLAALNCWKYIHGGIALERRKNRRIKARVNGNTTNGSTDTEHLPEDPRSDGGADVYPEE